VTRFRRRAATSAAACNCRPTSPSGPAGDVWAINNWQDIDSCYPGASEALSTRCGGQGVVIFFGMAKPVRAPQIGPAKPF
jgi:hypothetical protein